MPTPAKAQTLGIWIGSPMFSSMYCCARRAMTADVPLLHPPGKAGEGGYSNYVPGTYGDLWRSVLQVTAQPRW